MTDPQQIDDTLIIVTAAGRGSRAGGGLPKQWRPLGKGLVIEHTLAAFSGFRVVLTIQPDDQELALSVIRNLCAGPSPKFSSNQLTIVHGGNSRAASVRNALEAASNGGFKNVLIHDGARPLVSADLIARLIQKLGTYPAAAPALAVTDALWRGADGQVEAPTPRDNLWRAQTPQAFHFEAILAAHRAYQGDAADDVEVAMAHGLDVQIVEGEENNLKLTWAGDFARAEAIVKGRDMDIRIGNGYDVHAFTEGDHVWLCGVKIPHHKALLGHSDADVGMHALTDAIYGALAEGDIGRHFPPSDPQWKGAASWIFLDHAIKLARARGYELSNCDVTLICERPKIGPHAKAMQDELARIMEITQTGKISVKATTSERLGFTGREEGIAAVATVLLVKA